MSLSARAGILCGVAFHRVEDGPWPAGTTVTAYLTSSLVGGQPVGPLVSSGVASANGVVEFGGLTEGLSYTAFGSSGTQQFEAINQEARLVELEDRRNLLNVYKTTGPGTSGTPTSVDLTTALAGGSTTDTVQMTNMSLGPLPVVAGDLVEINCRMEFTNPNSAEMVGGVHFHDSLPVMAALGVKRHTAVDVNAGSMILRQIAMNWTYWSNHHLVMHHREWWVVDVTGNYYLYNQFYFASSASFRASGNTVSIEGGNYGLLEAAHWR